MNIDKKKILRSLAIILGIFIVVITLTQISRKSSLTLSEYAKQHPELQVIEEEDSINESDTNELSEKEIDITKADEKEEKNLHEVIPETSQTLTGSSLNGITQIENRVIYADSFYCESLSDNLKRYITGVSFPQASDDFEEELSQNQSDDFDSTDSVRDQSTMITYDDLLYVHLMHYDFDGNPAEGELICNKAIAQDLLEIFYELYQNEYRIEKIHLIDEYDGDDAASMTDNNTSCFNYRNVAGSTTLSKHALGLAIDVNPYYNPYITYNKDGSLNVAPEGATSYIDRASNFPYKIDENDLCYKLFIAHGFTWGGNWNSSKDYQHFQKNLN